MSGITLEIENLAAVQAAIRKYGKDAEREVAKAVTATGLKVRGDVVKAILRGPKTGTVYYRIRENGITTVRAGSADGPFVAAFWGGDNRSEVHRASAPGEPPATDTGRLASPTSFYEQRESPLSITIGSSLPYAAYLEFGTVKIEPRPAWLPATEKNRPYFAELVEAALRKVAP